MATVDTWYALEVLVNAGSFSEHWEPMTEDELEEDNHFETQAIASEIRDEMTTSGEDTVSYSPEHVRVVQMTREVVVSP